MAQALECFKNASGDANLVRSPVKGGVALSKLTTPSGKGQQ